ncbi:MAG: hypothetical protein KZQ81_14645 [Candidatus Thiodiazotropha sp. (ex Rostrolucina anterorostrata)]|nr:hypothetical protein [Candidatus Thiodiazotropha sp. (ex Rostrolucina anterorostrata)]
MSCGSTGIIKDVNAQILPPEAWTYANGVRFNGIDAIQEKPSKRLLTATYPVHLLVGWNDGVKGRLLLTTSTKIQEVTHLEHDERASKVVDRWVQIGSKKPIKLNHWSEGAFGGIPYFCAGFDQKPVVLMSDERGRPKAEFEALKSWPDEHSCSVMRHFSNHLIAIKMEVNGKENITRRPFDIMWFRSC